MSIERHELWDERPIAPQQGPLKDIYDAVWKTLQPKYMTKTKIEGQTAWKVDAEDISMLLYRRQGKSAYMNADFAAYRTKGSSDISLAIKKEGEDAFETERYIITPDGLITKLNNLEWEYDEEEEDSKFIIKSLDRLREIQIQSTQTKKYQSRRKIKTNSKKAALGTLATAVLTTGGLVAKHYFVDEPAREKAYAEAFDQKNLAIEGEPIKLAVGHLATLSSDVFESIPPYKSGDSLQSPRLITIRYGNEATSCTTIENPSEDTNPVFVFAAKEGTNEAGSSVRLGSEVSGRISICLDTNEDKMSGKIAVQVIEE